MEIIAVAIMVKAKKFRGKLMSKGRSIKKIKLLLLPLLVLFSVLIQQPCICTDGELGEIGSHAKIVRADHSNDLCSDCGHERSCSTHHPIELIDSGLQSDELTQLLKFVAVNLDAILCFVDQPAIKRDRAILDKQLHSSLKVYLLKRSLLI